MRGRRGSARVVVVVVDVVVVGDPIEAKSEEHGPGECSTRGNDDGSPPPSHVRVILLFLFPIWGGEEGANPTYEVIQDQHGYGKNHSYGKESDQGET